MHVSLALIVASDALGRAQTRVVETTEEHISRLNSD